MFLSPHDRAEIARSAYTLARKKGDIAVMAAALAEYRQARRDERRPVRINPREMAALAASYRPDWA